jgi:hypothetical protein
VSVPGTVVGGHTDVYLECGDLHRGFARLVCQTCGRNFLLAYSCKRRYFCPSCNQKRVVEFGEWLCQHSRIVISCSQSQKSSGASSSMIASFLQHSPDAQGNRLKRSFTPQCPHPRLPLGRSWPRRLLVTGRTAIIPICMSYARMAVFTGKGCSGSSQGSM